MAQTGSGENMLYLGVDVGGTKILANLVEASGAVVERERCPTPRQGGPEQVLAVIERVIDEVLQKESLRAADLAAIGIAVPGVVDPDEGRVVVTPNMNLTGVALGAHLEQRYKLPVAVGNDCNLGTLGEKWLGSARHARSAVGIFVGTGIGGGFVQRNRVWRGAREGASEVGHMVIQIDGPLCGCGNRGCLEALASRTAIERDLREAIAAGRESVLPGLLDGDLGVIRSGAIRKALESGDALVTEVMRRASEILGYGCLTIRHLVDPEVIVLGGGVVEACSDFILPIVENIVGSDQLPGARGGGRVLLSALGDDAVALGAVALAARRIGRNPLKKRYAVRPKYPEIRAAGPGEIQVGSKAFDRDIYVYVSGKVKKRKKSLSRQHYGTAHSLGPKELEKVCTGGPEILFVGTGREGRMELTDEARRFLEQRAIQVEALPTPEAVEAFNASKRRKAALFHVTC